MPEPILDELAVLRQTNAELVAKLANRATRITELETQLATSQTLATTAQASLHEIEVTRPTRTLAEAISPTPELFLMELQRVGYSIVKQDGKLTLMQGDKPVEGTEVTVDGLKKLLLSSDAKHKNFPSLIVASRASGGGAKGGSDGRLSVTTNDKPAPTKPIQFGLR